MMGEPSRAIKNLHMDKQSKKQPKEAKQVVASQAPAAEKAGGVFDSEESFEESVASRAAPIRSTDELAVLEDSNPQPSTSAGVRRRYRRISSEDSYFGGNVHLPDPAIESREAGDMAALEKLTSVSGMASIVGEGVSGYSSDSSRISLKRPRSSQAGPRGKRGRGHAEVMTRATTRERSLFPLDSDDDLLPGRVTEYLDKSLPSILKEVGSALADIIDVSKKSRNLKGGFIKRLQSSSRKIGEATSELGHRISVIPGSEMAKKEMEQLRRQNERHKLRVTQLETDLDEFRRHRIEELRVERESPKRTNLLSEIGSLMDNKLRLLREEILQEVGKAPVRATSPTPAESERTAIGRVSETLSRMAPTQGQLVPKKTTSKGAKKKERRRVAKAVAVASCPTPPAQPALRRPPRQEEIPWTQVLGRKKRATTCKSPINIRGAAPAKPSTPVKKPTVGRRPSRAAVLITALQGGNCTYAEAMKVAREKIDIKALGIETIRPKRSNTGGLILEVGGKGGAAKADCLVQQLSEAMAGRRPLGGTQASSGAGKESGAGAARLREVVRTGPGETARTFPWGITRSEASESWGDVGSEDEMDLSDLPEV